MIVACAHSKRNIENISFCRVLSSAGPSRGALDAANALCQLLLFFGGVLPPVRAVQVVQLGPKVITPSLEGIMLAHVCLALAGSCLPQELRAVVDVVELVLKGHTG